MHEDEKIEKDKFKIQFETILKLYYIQLIGFEHENKVIATCMVVVKEGLSYGGRPFDVIENVITDKSFRNKGVGKLIVQTVVEKER